MSLSKITLIVITALHQFVYLNASINVREGLLSPFHPDELTLADHETISKFYKTPSSQYKYKTQQKYKGIPIFGALLVFEQPEIDSVEATPVFGTWYDPNNIHMDIHNINPKLSSFEALEIAVSTLNIIHPLKNESVLYIYHDAKRSTFYLSYIIKLSYIDDHNHPATMKMILNANTGEILQKYDANKGFTVCGTGGNDKIGAVRYCGENALSINAMNSGQTQPILANHYVQIYDNLNKDYTDTSSASLMRCTLNATSSLYEVEDRAINDGYCAGCDVFEFTNFIFDLFIEHMDTLPVSDEHIPLSAYVHTGISWDSSYYDDIHGAVHFGDGDTLRYPLSVIDIVGHEIAHAFTAKTSDLISSDESGGIDNFYADLIGEIAEYFYYGSNDWRIGTNSYRAVSGADRYLDEPTLDGVSIDNYADYYTGMNPYYSSGIYSKAIYLLNTQYSWSMLDIFKVFTRSNELYWSPYIDFTDALCGVYQSLTDLYGSNQTELLSLSYGLLQAFKAVSVECVHNQTISTCGNDQNTYCIYKEIEPSLSQDTAFTVYIALPSNIEGIETNAHIYVTVKENECKSPSISLEYEQIDLDNSNEFILIKDAEDNVIHQCGADWNCGEWNTTCLVDYKLGISGINIDNTYSITLEVSPEVNALCGDRSKVINAKLIFKCALHTPSPTYPQPTAVPITVAPSTLYPTPIPTYPLVECGDNCYRYDVDVFPSNDTQTQTVLGIQNTDLDVDVYYHISFNIYGDIDCNIPTLMFEYESIDYDQSTEFISIYDDSDGGKQIAHCSGNQDCDAFATCLWNYPLKNKIVAGTTYNISVMQSSSVDALCSHELAINARLQLNCEGGTAKPTQTPTAEPTRSPIVPTAEPPSVSPTHVTSGPTASPTEQYICGSNRVCSDVDVVPVYDAVTLWNHMLQYGTSRSDMNFSVLFNVKDRYCVNPSISVKYQQIDYDGPREYFDVLDNNGSTITRCGTAFACDVFDDCLLDYSLGISGIAPNTTYQINVFLPRSVDAQCRNGGNQAWSINANITLRCVAGTMNPTTKPTLEPSSSPTTPTIDPTPAPTYYRQHCGLNTYCYHMYIYPETDEDTEWKLAIQNANDSSETYFDIWIVPYITDCVAPTISFEFERIDNNAHSEYIQISSSDGLYDTRCGGDGVSNVCGVFDTCINNTALGVHKIKKEDSYKLTVFESDQVEAECPDSYLSINAILSIKCYGITAIPTASPTPEPTNNPTQTTHSPSYTPTTQPTDVSQPPTTSPTHDIRVCGEHQYCVFENIYPIQSTDTTFDVPIQHIDEDAVIVYDVYFTPKELECINPSISFVYEGIDYDQPYEYINISDTNGALLTQCNGESFSCDSFVSCLDDYDLNIQRIQSNNSYLITVVLSAEVDALCRNNLALNSILSITCHNSDSVIPTESPTPEPTNNPTKPTLIPSRNPSISPTLTTWNPTLTPTHAMQTCGLNTYCIYVDLYPDLDIDTSYQVPIVYNDINAALQFDVIFAVQNDIECNNPLISYNLELIDLDDDDEYVNVTDINGKELAICGAVSFGQDCGVFVDCFKNIKIGENINTIGLSDTYTVGVYVTEKVDALCRSYHQYAINSVLTLYCSKGTAQPTFSPTTATPTVATLDPTKSPTISPSQPSSSPTLSPTWSVLCDLNTWCYYLEILPSMTDQTTWTVPIQFDDSNANWRARGTSFRVAYYVSGLASNACVAPKISFIYETIDYDGDFEYINVGDADGNSIAECGIDNPNAECNVFETCIDNVLLQNTIEIDEEYEILIYQPADVDSLCSTLDNPYALNATLILQCESGTAIPSVSPTQYPSAQPTVPTTTPSTMSPTQTTVAPTNAPTYAMIDCGTETYCIYVDMFPNKQQQTSYSVQVQQVPPDIKSDTVFDIYFTSHGEDCVEPFITFTFETIDYDEEDEYLNITYGNSVIRCGGDKGSNACGAYEVCLNQSRLERVNKIAVNESYKLSVIRSKEVSALCWVYHDWAINAELTMSCAKGTASPTYDPTPEPSRNPTLMTVSPTPSPSFTPTVPTLSPTLSPTFSHHLCQEDFKQNKWCYFAPIYPMDNELTDTMISIQGQDDSKETVFEITFTPQYIDCMNPIVTLRYENIDLDGDEEFIEIFDDGMNVLKRCGAIWECDTFDFCLKNYELNTTSIIAGTNYTITIIEQDEVDGLCGSSDYSFNAELTLKCNNKIPETDMNDDKCGDNKYCYQNTMHPKSIIPTVWTQYIQHLNHEETTEFQVRFVAQNERCYEPTLQIMYERIDFDQSTEFIDIYDNNSVLITRCGAGKLENECGSFDTCIDDYILPTLDGYIEMSDAYTISLFESKDVDAICSNHSYSINAMMSIHCAPKSTQIIKNNLTINIEGSATVHQRLFERLISTTTDEPHQRFDVIYNINDYECLNPSFSVSTNIKLNAQYLQNVIVYDDNLDKIGQCTSMDNPMICPYSMDCVSHYVLNETSLQIGEEYRFIIYVILETDTDNDWCDTDHTMQSQLSFYCHGIPSISPTPAPTTFPTIYPTVQPSLVPTQTPTVPPTIVTILSTSNANAQSVEHEGTNVTKTRIMIITIIVLSCCVVCLFLCWWIQHRKQGNVAYKRPTETEMQETNRLAVSPLADSDDDETPMTQGMSTSDDDTPMNPKVYHGPTGVSTKKRKYSKIGENDDNDNVSFS